jgi:molybdate transport system substrate-binding protein
MRRKLGRTAGHRRGARAFLPCCAALLGLALGVGSTQAPGQSNPATEPLRVLSSNGVRAALEDVQPALEAALGTRIAFVFSTAASLTEQIESGTAFDVAVLTPPLIDRLQQIDAIRADSRSSFARTGVGVGARIGTVDADISSVSGFADLLRRTGSVAFTAEGQSRRAIDDAFEQLELTELMRSKSLILGPGEAPIAVTDGRAELVLTLTSEIVPVDGLELIGPLPEELQVYVSFTAAVSSSASNEALARAFVDQLAGPAVAAALQARGLEALLR